MSNLDNQPGRDDRIGSTNRTSIDQGGLDTRKTGMGTGTIAAIIGAAVIVGGLMLFGSWGDNRTAVNNPPAATSNSTPGTTTGQTSGAPRVITPNVAPAAPATTAPAPATTR
ncbi:MAG: hypothetical protein Q7J60_25020 [Bradyrhizobium sp.]|uniref:hypothetical protein n=1 Tax=Bradyrhizobium sp. TaxID=376 RepID=UPI0027245566|nr:hypothetical protein [Bradyrhizobium sp.]MDO9564897.1 hypothetical protein [Bradyrhizobium sp.]MDP3691403.1 hypothetical protein [Bradyrhizobium sp.]